MNLPSPIVSRIAPTPSGYLHLGNAFSFVLTWLIVRSQSGANFLHLRIDDLDADRKRPEYVQDVFDTLEWLGVSYDAGPRSVEEFEDVFSQRHRIPAYHAAIERLCTASEAVFACECSRMQIVAASPTGRYPGTCRSRGLEFDVSNTALRLTVPDEKVVRVQDWLQGEVDVAIGQTMGSFVVRRKDGIPAYHLASVVDDCSMGVNVIVRGADLLPSTAAQVLFAQKLPLLQFQKTQFFHHPLLTEADGRKLSKSDGSLSLRSLRDDGVKATQVYQYVARALKLEYTNVQTIGELLEVFSMDALKELAGRNHLTV